MTFHVFHFKYTRQRFVNEINNINFTILKIYIFQKKTRNAIYIMIEYYIEIINFNEKIREIFEI